MPDTATIVPFGPPEVGTAYSISYKDPLRVQHVIFARPHPRRASEREVLTFRFDRRESGPLRLVETIRGRDCSLATAAGETRPVRRGRHAIDAEAPRAARALMAWRAGEVDKAAAILADLVARFREGSHA